MTHSYVFRVIFAFVSLNEEWFVPHSEWLSTVQFRVICTFTSSRVIWSHSIYTHINYTCTFFSVHFAGDTHWLSPYICIYIYIFAIKRTHSHYYSKQRIQPDDYMYVHFIPHISLAKWREHILITTKNNAFNLLMMHIYFHPTHFAGEMKRTHSHYYSKQRIQPNDYAYILFILRISPAKRNVHIIFHSRTRISTWSCVL